MIFSLIRLLRVNSRCCCSSSIASYGHQILLLSMISSSRYLFSNIYGHQSLSPCGAASIYYIANKLAFASDGSGFGSSNVAVSAGAVETYCFKIAAARSAVAVFGLVVSPAAPGR